MKPNAVRKILLSTGGVEPHPYRFTLCISRVAFEATPTECSINVGVDLCVNQNIYCTSGKNVDLYLH